MLICVKSELIKREEWMGMQKDKKGKTKRGIKSRLIISFSVIAVLPLIIIGAMSYQQAAISLEQEVGQKVEEFATVQMEKLDRTMYERTRDVQSLAQADQVVKFQDEEQDLTSYLEQQLHILNYFETFTVFSLDGVAQIQTHDQQVDRYDASASWWIEAIESGLAYSDITYDEKLDQHVIVIHTTISSGENVIGLLEATYNVEYIWDDVNHIVSENSIVELVNNEGTKIADTVSSASVVESNNNEDAQSADATSGASVVDDQLDQASQIFRIISSTDAGDTGFIKDQNSVGDEAMIGYATSSGYDSYLGNHWSLIVSEPTDVALSSIQRLGELILIVAAVTLLTVVLLSIYISNSIAKPLILLKDRALMVADGKLTEKITVKGAGEVRLLADAMNRMVENLQTTIKQTNQASNRIGEQSSALKDVSGELQSGSEQLASTMQEIAAGAEHQASASIDISKVGQELDDSINEVHQQSVSLEKSSKSVWKLSNDGKVQMDTSLAQITIVNQAVEKAVEKVKGLEDSSLAVSKLTSVINEITEQTNLLALNAAIESARAGEAGKGFSVVSNEIKKLAEQTSVSAIDIANVIGEMQRESIDLGKSLNHTFQQADKSVADIKKSATYFAEIKQEITTMNDGIATVAHALNGIELNSKEMNNGINQIAAVSEESSAGIEETAAFIQQQKDAVDYLTDQSVNLQELSEHLHVMVSKFEV